MFGFHSSPLAQIPPIFQVFGVPWIRAPQQCTFSGLEVPGTIQDMPLPKFPLTTKISGLTFYFNLSVSNRVISIIVLLENKKQMCFPTYPK